jgi:hypothetical protein
MVFQMVLQMEAKKDHLDSKRAELDQINENRIIMLETVLREKETKYHTLNNAPSTLKTDFVYNLLITCLGPTTYRFGPCRAALGQNLLKKTGGLSKSGCVPLPTCPPGTRHHQAAAPLGNDKVGTLTSV